MRQIWKEKLFENIIILLFVKSVCCYLSYRAKYEHTVNDFSARILLFFPLYMTLGHVRNYIKRLPRIATCALRSLNDVALLAKARFEMKFYMYVCMYVLTDCLSVLLYDELTFCHHSLCLIVCFADCLSNYLSDLTTNRLPACQQC